MALRGPERQIFAGMMDKVTSGEVSAETPGHIHGDFLNLRVHFDLSHLLIKIYSAMTNAG